MTAYNERVAFCHIPKTAGHAVRAYMAEHLPGLKHFSDTHPHGGSYGHVALRDFKRHCGRGPEDFERIYAVVRDPYDHQLSQWIYWQDMFKRGFRGDQFEHAALHSDLTHWLMDPISDWHVHDRREVGDVYRTTATTDQGYREFGGYYPYWLAVDGVIPDNVQVVSFEHLDTELPMALKEFTGIVREMTHENVGPKRRTKDPYEYYSALAVEIVEAKFAWAFENLYQKWEKVA